MIRRRSCQSTDTAKSTNRVMSGGTSSKVAVKPRTRNQTGAAPTAALKRRPRRALITNPPKAGRPMWVCARKIMFCKGAATPGLNKVDGIMIKARLSHRLIEVIDEFVHLMA